jgi:hypothetical protein
MAIAASYVSGTSFTVSGDRAAELAVGVRVRADCGADGYVYGTVTAAGYPTRPPRSRWPPGLRGAHGQPDRVEHGNDGRPPCAPRGPARPGGRDPVPRPCPGFRPDSVPAKAVPWRRTGTSSFRCPHGLGRERDILPWPVNRP